MKRLLVLATLALVVGLPAIAEDDVLTADEILERVNATWQGDSFHGVLALDVVLGGQTKSHKLEVWTLGEDYALVRVLEPEVDVNSGYLQAGDTLWYRSPGAAPIKLPAVALGDALFGAGPSLEDLSHGTLSDDYDVHLDTRSETGFFLTLVPHADAPVVYGKLEIWVSDVFVIEQLIYYDQRGAVLQIATFTDVIDVGGRLLASTILIEDAFGDRTVERIELAQFDVPLEPEFFHLDTFDSWDDQG